MIDWFNAHPGLAITIGMQFSWWFGFLFARWLYRRQ